MVQYILMNKNTPVVAFSYDAETHSVVKITDVYDLRYAPPAVLDHKGSVTKRNLNDWWRRRAIPASRNQIRQLLDTLDLSSTLTLAEQNFGLSLSDRYWINDPAAPLNWSDVNFFDNDFTDDLGLLTLGQASHEPSNFMSPNSTLGGDLEKKWTIINGERILLKTGSALFRQEVQNEAVATCLHRRLLNDDEYVPYYLHREGRSVYSACPNMLKEDEELITAFDILCNKRKANSQSDYQFLVSCYKALGLENVEETLCKMFTCDYILANEDRHWRNFGVIRNVETLEYTRIAPIFDNGTCLWCRSDTLSSHMDFKYIAKPFGKAGMEPDKQLMLFQEYAWFEPEKLKGFPDEAVSILAQNENIPAKRLDALLIHIENNIRQVCRHAELCKAQGHTLDAVSQECRNAASVLNGSLKKSNRSWKNHSELDK